MRKLKWIPVAVWVGAAFLVSGTPRQAPPSPAGFAGSAACQQCHAEQTASYLNTAHRKTMGSGFPPERHGCEACHGPAKAHTDLHLTAFRLYSDGKTEEATALYTDETRAAAARMKRIPSMKPAEVNALCLRCHEGSQGRTEERFNFRRSDHARHGVSCLDCHSSHSPKSTEFLVRASQPALCVGCHAEQRASFAKPFHHKVPEGAMKCSDCHNQHGGFTARQLRSGSAGDSTCLKCHSDKAGPFVYEHAPVKTEGCQSCHAPHGSNNPRLLIRSEVRFLCLECHSNTPSIRTDSPSIGPSTPSFHDLTNPRYRNCTVCHSAIHGSNSHRAYFR